MSVEPITQQQYNVAIAIVRSYVAKSMERHGLKWREDMPDQHKVIVEIANGTHTTLEESEHWSAMPLSHVLEVMCWYENIVRLEYPSYLDHTPDDDERSYRPGKTGTEYETDAFMR